MTTADIYKLYARHIKPLPVEDRLRLRAVMARELARRPADAPQRPAASSSCTAAAATSGTGATPKNTSTSCAKSGAPQGYR
jgi:hypothetical protein